MKNDDIFNKEHKSKIIDDSVSNSSFESEEDNNHKKINN